ncbi:hypothetical protein TNIN_147371 [Trichonephila inaurata madagascariensis]|uniref:Uncharacterized protein n=1 Tax=Trichonephila inaurata madagascariensis TaxID=2747483 RepID=A0A8X7CSY9_9ARAC|nr:hypothetical protein TNIN_147371 [Trichonephila inaurata madagascariensis]
MDDDIEMGFPTFAEELLYLVVGILRVRDVMAALSYEIPWYFSVMYFAIQIFVGCRIPEEGMWRLEASLLTSFVFCHMCAKGSSIFQIAVDVSRESFFTKAGNVYILVLFLVVSVFSSFFLFL